MDYEMKQIFETAIPVFREMYQHYQNNEEWKLRFTRAKEEEKIKKQNMKKKIEAVATIILVIAFTLLLSVLLKIIEIMHLQSLETIIMGASLVGLFIVAVKVKNMISQYVDESKDSSEFAQQKTIINQNMENESATIKLVYAQNWDLVESFPNDYRYCYAIESIYKILLNGRADSMKEALNIFEEDCHRMRMEHNMVQMLNEQMQFCRYLASISSEVYQLKQQMNQ